MRQSVSLLGTEVFAGGLEGARKILESFVSVKCNRCEYAVCVNPHSLVVAQRDPLFMQALAEASLVVPDGVGVKVILKGLYGREIERVTGSDLFAIMTSLATPNRPLKFFFLGAAETTLEEIRRRLALQNPNVIWAGGYSPPYVSVLSDADNEAMLAAVRTASPDVLWVGMTAPKQEKWIFSNRDKIDARFVGAIGAVFDYYAGVNARPTWAAEFGLEWLVRLVQEPRRLWRRTFVSMPLFVLYALKERFKDVS